MIGVKHIKLNCVRKRNQSNADYIRSLSDEELAEFLLNRDMDCVEKASEAVGFKYHYDRENCMANILKWLREDVNK